MEHLLVYFAGIVTGVVLCVIAVYLYFRTKINTME